MSFRTGSYKFYLGKLNMDNIYPKLPTSALPEAIDMVPRYGLSDLATILLRVAPLGVDLVIFWC